MYFFSFPRKNQATNMKVTGVIITEKPINIDPQVLFQCLIAIKNHHEYLSELFEYKLCSHLPALFDRYRLLKKHKSHRQQMQCGGN